MKGFVYALAILIGLMLICMPLPGLCADKDFEIAEPQHQDMDIDENNFRAASEGVAPSPTPIPIDKSSTPKTGDTTTVIAYICLAYVCMWVIILLIYAQIRTDETDSK